MNGHALPRSLTGAGAWPGVTSGAMIGDLVVSSEANEITAALTLLRDCPGGLRSSPAT